MAAVIGVGLVGGIAADAGTQAPPARSFSIDYKSLTSRADIDYDRPAERSEAGLPIGNGRMGSLIWTTPDALRFQINRVDVFADDSSTQSFPRANTDYASGCGYVDIRFVDFGDDVFAGSDFHQHLSVYDGLMTARGRGIVARAIASREHDVLAVEIDDRREHPSPVSVDLRMLRYAVQYAAGQNYALASKHAVSVRTDGHTATSRLEIRDGRILLIQEFREGGFYDASAVAIGIVGRGAQARYSSESAARLSAAPGRGSCTILMASAASADPRQDVGALALKELDAATVEGFDGMLARNQAWWRDYWSRAFVRLHSDDGTADFVEQSYTYFLYIMASSSYGGEYPPRFGGMLWYTNGDMRQWGSQYWWANMSCYYNGLAPANRFELTDPLFAMYSRMQDSCALAARQQWGSEGIWIPETVFFDGLETLPDDIASEMRDLYLMRKPWEKRSAAFQRFAETKSRFASRWNWMANAKWDQGRWVFSDKGGGPFGHTSHMLSSTAKIAYLYWQRYEYTQDRNWLRERAYPMLKGAAEFYRHFPNLTKGDDGKYHIHNVNSSEPVWGAQDTDEDLSAMRAILGALLRASEILDRDADLRPAWQDLLKNLAPLPTSDDPTAIKPEDYRGPRVWVKALRPVVHGNGMLPDPNSLPMWGFDLCTPETPDPAMQETANATFNAYFPQGILPQTPLSVLSRLPIAAAALGRADAVQVLLPNQLRCLGSGADFCDWEGTGHARILPNRLTLREGPGAIECERLGRAAEALHTALLQSAPAEPGGAPILRVFPAWPATWDADYTLAARGGFLVSASTEKGRIGFVEIRSQVGGECRLHNPWPDVAVTLYRDGRQAGDLSGAVLSFPTDPGEGIVLVPKGEPLPHRKVS